ncbi:MAG: topoisomerase DNA-binding C4 zinc finger domain-containing protein [Lachnospiraceae bacterium]|nr:topoisomerase DNA-binding C4 zinc finger domain-containing protein [Lachnospiraceae bacterium]
MAQRTVALCDGKYIGIESIYTAVNGHQINIPDKLKELRSKSQNNELFCPCGCGANLILVAGDKNLREQHFRIKDAYAFQDCHMVTEGKTSVDSKIVLKCWLDDNLHAEDLESRVPISAVTDSSRKYEFSFISRNARIALNYCHDRVNLSDEKLSILEENSNGIHIIHVVDFLNGGSDGQYPEWLMKVQNRQGYCLLLDIEESDYEKANLRAVFYEKDIDGLWQEISFSDAALRDFRILPDGSITIHETNLIDLLESAKRHFLEGIETEKKRREDAEKQRAERIKQQQLEAERWREEQKKRQEEAEKRRAEESERRKLEEEKRAEEERRRDEDFKRSLEERLNQQETQVRDAYGNRWIKCEFCGKIAKDSEFSSYGGAIGVHLNLGTCKECSAHNPAAKPSYRSAEIAPKRAYDLTICPECGSKLIEKNGRNGRFIGCSGYPRCRYTRTIR